MKKGKLKDRLDKMWKQMRHHLHSFITTQHQDDLHQFRVQIKKIKSFLILLSSNEKNEELLKIFKPIKKIFHQGGVIRDAYIHLQFAEEFRVNEPGFVEQQKELVSAETISFCSKGKKYLQKLDSVHKKVKKEFTSIRNSDVIFFYESELNGVVLALAKREFCEEMHDCRKRIKNLLYNEKLALKKLDGKLELNPQYLNQVQEKLGEWHDRVLARDVFLNQVKDEKPAIEKLNLQISKLEKSIIMISSNFWKRATSKSSN